MDFAWVLLFDSFYFVRQVCERAALFRWHQVVILNVPTVEIVHVLVWFWGVVMQ